MKHFFLGLSLIFMVACLTKNKFMYVLNKEDIKKETETDYIQELNGDLTAVDASVFWNKVPFGKDSIKLTFFNYHSANFDSLLPVFSDQVSWVSSNNELIVKKFQDAFNYKGQLNIKELYFHKKGGCAIYFESNTDSIEETLFINTKKEFFTGYFFDLKKL
jgi:hypothetical protein